MRPDGDGCGLSFTVESWVFSGKQRTPVWSSVATMCLLADRSDSLPRSWAVRVSSASGKALGTAGLCLLL